MGAAARYATTYCWRVATYPQHHATRVAVGGERASTYIRLPERTRLGLPSFSPVSRLSVYFYIHIQ